MPNANYYNLPFSIQPTYMQQWNLSVQRQVSEWLFTANYLGNKSTHRWTNRATNPAIYIPGTCAGQPCSTTANTTARRFLARLSPAGANIGPMSILDDGANSSYNALLLSVDRRLSRNFSMLLNYTFSHCLSDGDGDPGIGGSYQNPDSRRAEHGNCSTDQRQMLNASVIAMSPRFQTVG